MSDVTATSKKSRRKRREMSSVPYAAATTGRKVREEITKILRQFGCESIGFMDDFEKRELLLAFTHRGRKVQRHASAKGWAALFLRDKPWTARHHIGRVDYEHRALAQGQIAVNSILRDLVKAQITAVESGMLSFEAVFMPHMLTADGQPLIDRVQELSPRPDEPKVVPMISHKP